MPKSIQDLSLLHLFGPPYEIFLLAYIMSAVYSEAEVAEHNTEKSCWIIIGNESTGGKKVYDVTKFLYDHPGGPEIILDLAGKDADEMFEDIGHTHEARSRMKEYLIGSLKVEKNVAAPAPAETPHSWLATRLLNSGYTLSQAKDCHIKLVETEGFLAESDFAYCPTNEFDAPYLTRVGITAKGLQCHLIKLQAELHKQAQTQTQTQQETSAASAPPALASLSVLPSSVKTNYGSDFVNAQLIERVQELETQMAYLLSSTASLDPVYVRNTNI